MFYLVVIQQRIPEYLISIKNCTGSGLLLSKTFKRKVGYTWSFKNIFDRFLDLDRGREVSVNQMVDRNYKANAKIVRVFL